MQMRLLFLQKDLRVAVGAPLRCMCGRTVGIFGQAIFRSPLVESDRRTAMEEVARAERRRQRQKGLNETNKQIKIILCDKKKKDDITG